MRNYTLPGLYGGISTQIPELRLPNQVADANNMDFSITDGAKKRGGTVNIFSDITPTGLRIGKLSEDYIEYFEFSDGSRYAMRINQAIEYNVELLNLDTGVRILLDEASTAFNTYITIDNTTDPVKRFSTVQIGDEIIITNSSAIVQLGGAIGYPVDEPYVIWINRAYPNVTYTLTVYIVDNNTSTPYTLVSEYTATATDDASFVAERLLAILEQDCLTKTSNALTTYFTTDNINSFVYLKPIPANVTVDKVDMEDGIGGIGSKLIYKNVAKVTDLPSAYPFEKKVVGITDSTEPTGLYLSWSDSNNAWVEDRSPDTDYVFSGEPVYIRKNTGVDSFSTGVFNLADKLVGDDESNPAPAFVGKSIKDLVFFKNRLGIVSGESISFSRDGDYGNFFGATMFDILDTDPIDLTVSSNGATYLDYALVFEDSCMLFAASAGKQFAVSGAGIFSPNTVEVALVSSYSMINTRPVVGDVSIFMLSGTLDKPKVLELFRDGRTESTFSGVDVSSVIEGLFQPLASLVPRQKLLVYNSSVKKLIYTDITQGIAYVLQLKEGEQGKRIQQSWTKYNLDLLLFEKADGILVIGGGNDFIFYKYENVIISNTPSSVQTAERVIAYTMDLVSDDIRTDDTFYITGSDVDSNGTFYLPIGVSRPAGRTFYLIYNNKFYQLEYNTVPSTYTILNITPEDLTALRAETEKVIQVGRAIEASVQLSKFYVRDSEGIAVLGGFTLIRSLNIVYSNTANMTCEVKSAYGDYDVPVAIQTLPFAFNNASPEKSGTAHVPVRGYSKDIDVTLSSVSPFRMNINIIAVNYDYTNKAQR